MESTRRYFIKPTDIGEGALASLRQRLQSAVLLQQKLGEQSLHVLRFFGELKETDHAFYVDHESLIPEDFSDFYASNSHRPDEVIRDYALGLVDALSVAHNLDSLHGGLCPGVLGRNVDGLVVVTDFGIAPAYYSACGSDCFIGMAVESAERAGINDAAGRAWALLDEDESSDGRITAFLETQDHSSNVYHPPTRHTDILAAGEILFVLSEGRHPYLEIPDHQGVWCGDAIGVNAVTLPVMNRGQHETDSELAKLIRATVLESLPSNPVARISSADLRSRWEAHIAYDSAAIREKRRLRRANNTIQKLELLADAEDWNAFTDLLDGVELKLQTIPAVRNRLDQVVERFRARQSKDRNKQRAVDWVTALRSIVAANDPTAAVEHCGTRPNLEALTPAEIAEADELCRQATVDFENATEKHIGELANAIGEGRIIDARSLMDRGPSADAIPKVHRPHYDELATALTSLEERIRRDNDDAEKYLRRVEALLTQDAINDAKTHIESPPHLEFPPDSFQSDLAKLRSRVQRAEANHAVTTHKRHDDLLATAIERIRDAVIRRHASSEVLTKSRLELELDRTEKPAPAIQGRLVATILDSKGKPRASSFREISGEFKDGAVALIDEKTIVDDLATATERQIHEHQSNSLDKVCKALVGTLFPDSSWRTEWTAGSVEASVALQCLQNATPTPLGIAEIHWDHERFDWIIADCSNLVETCSDAVIEQVLSHVRDTCLKGATAAPSHRAHLTWHAEADSAKKKPCLEMPDGLPFTVRAFWKSESKSPCFQSGVTYHGGNDIRIAAAATKLENAVRQRIARAQKDALTAIKEELKHTFELQIRKQRPKTINRFVPSLDLTLKRSDGKEISVEAPWSSEMLRFELPETVAEFAAKARQAPPKTKQSARSEPEPESPQRVNPSPEPVPLQSPEIATADASSTNPDRVAPSADDDVDRDVEAKRPESKPPGARLATRRRGILLSSIAIAVAGVAVTATIFGISGGDVGNDNSDPEPFAGAISIRNEEPINAGDQIRVDVTQLDDDRAPEFILEEVLDGDVQQEFELRDTRSLNESNGPGRQFVVSLPDSIPSQSATNQYRIRLQHADEDPGDNHSNLFSIHPVDFQHIRELVDRNRAIDNAMKALTGRPNAELAADSGTPAPSVEPLLKVLDESPPTLNQEGFEIAWGNDKTASVSVDFADSGPTVQAKRLRFSYTPARVLDNGRIKRHALTLPFDETSSPQEFAQENRTLLIAYLRSVVAGKIRTLSDESIKGNPASFTALGELTTSAAMIPILDDDESEGDDPLDDALSEYENLPPSWASLAGWRMEKEIQSAPGNESDRFPFYPNEIQVNAASEDPYHLILTFADDDDSESPKMIPTRIFYIAEKEVPVQKPPRDDPQFEKQLEACVSVDEWCDAVDFLRTSSSQVDTDFIRDFKFLGGHWDLCRNSEDDEGDVAFRLVGGCTLDGSPFAAMTKPLLSTAIDKDVSEWLASSYLLSQEREYDRFFSPDNQTSWVAYRKMIAVWPVNAAP